MFLVCWQGLGGVLQNVFSLNIMYSMSEGFPRMIFQGDIKTKQPIWEEIMSFHLPSAQSTATATVPKRATAFSRSLVDCTPGIAVGGLGGWVDLNEVTWRDARSVGDQMV